MSVFAWIGILSSLVIYSMASDNVEYRIYWSHQQYLHGWGGDDLYNVMSGRYLWLALWVLIQLMASSIKLKTMYSNYTSLWGFIYYMVALKFTCGAL